MAGPGDEVAGAEGRGGLRASHADREQVIGALKGAFVQGRLTQDEPITVGLMLDARHQKRAGGQLRLGPAPTAGG